MSCHGSNEGNSKRRIAIISTVCAGAAGIVAYVSSTNPAFAATLSALLVFAACPVMCAAMGGIMWLNRRLSKKKAMKMLQQHQEEPRQTIQHQQPKQKPKESEIQQGSHHKQRGRGL
jgi:hypothetical protein